MARKKKENSWLEAYKRIRKRIPPPTRVKPGEKGKGVPYKRKRDEYEKEEKEGAPGGPFLTISIN